MSIEKLVELLEQCPFAATAVLGLGCNKLHVYVSEDKTHVMFATNRNHDDILALGYVEVTLDPTT